MLLALATHFCLSCPVKANERVTVALTSISGQLTSQFIFCTVQ